MAKKLQINKAVQISDSSGNVEAKQVQLPVEGRLDWMQMLRKDIFHFGMGVDTESDDWGKAASGVALKFQYAMFYLFRSSVAKRKNSFTARLISGTIPLIFR